MYFMWNLIGNMWSVIDVEALLNSYHAGVYEYSCSNSTGAHLKLSQDGVRNLFSQKSDTEIRILMHVFEMTRL